MIDLTESFPPSGDSTPNSTASAKRKKVVQWRSESDMEEVRYFNSNNNTEPRNINHLNLGLDEQQSKLQPQDGISSKINSIGENIHIPPPSISNFSRRLGLTFSVQKITSFLRNGKFADSIGQGFAVYITAVLQHVCTEIIDDAVLLCVNEGKDGVDPKRVIAIIRGDSDLKELFRCYFHAPNPTNTIPTDCVSLDSNHSLVNRDPDVLVTKVKELIDHGDSDRSISSVDSCTTTISSGSSDIEGRPSPNFAIDDVLDELDTVEAVEENGPDWDSIADDKKETNMQANIHEAKPLFADHIYQIFKQTIHSSRGISIDQQRQRSILIISKKAVRLINDLLLNLLERIACNTARELRRTNQKTFCSRYAHHVVGSLLSGDLSVYAQLAGSQALKCLLKL